MISTLRPDTSSKSESTVALALSRKTPATAIGHGVKEGQVFAVRPITQVVLRHQTAIIQALLPTSGNLSFYADPEQGSVQVSALTELLV
jgi:hypothetical protein